MFTTITKSDILDMANELVKKNGSTTTKEIKKELRNKSFWIFQKTVSDVMSENYEAMGMERTFNGEYYTYTMATTDDSVEVDDDDDDNDSSSKKGKVVSDPEVICSGTYSLKVSIDGEDVELSISNCKNAFSNDSLVYEVRDIDGNCWYLFASNKDLITRHKAIYYVWKAVKNEYNGNLTYSSLRSTKL